MDGWFFSLEMYFKKHNTHRGNWVDFAVDFLRESELTTFRSIENWESFSWEQFKSTFNTHYQEQKLQRVLRHTLSKLIQFDTIYRYIDELHKIMNQIRNMSEEDKIEYLVSGLNREISNKVAFEEPTSLVEAKALATNVETYYARGSGYEKTYDAQKSRNGSNNHWNNASKGEGMYPRDGLNAAGGMRDSLRKSVINSEHKSKMVCLNCRDDIKNMMISKNDIIMGQRNYKLMSI